MMAAMALRAGPSRGSLGLVITVNAILRVASGAGTVLVGLYVAQLADLGRAVGAGLAGAFAAVSFGAELIGAVPLGLLADVVSARVVMTGGAMLAAVATLLLGLTDDRWILLGSRVLEGLAAAAVVPSLLAHVTDATAADHSRRARAMSYFELSLLAGLALGGLCGAVLWARLGTAAFLALSTVYLGAAVLLWVGATTSATVVQTPAWRALRRALARPQVRQLAPIWICMNAILGLWLGPTVTFLLTHAAPEGSQQLVGLFAGRPTDLGWMLFGYALVFGTGVVIWSRVLPRMSLGRVLRISLQAMLGVCLGLLILNRVIDQTGGWAAVLIGVIALLIMVESGFTPAALTLLADMVGPAPGRGAAMGVYSFLLGVGALMGSVLAGLSGAWWAIDGLTFSTLTLALLALALLPRLQRGLARMETASS